MAASTKQKMQHEIQTRWNYLNYFSIFLSLFGMIVSCYALHVEISKEHDPTYKAFCDIASSVSCSKVFTSRYGKGFGLIDRVLSEESFLNQPNSIFGLIFYSTIIILCLLRGYTTKISLIQLILCGISNIGSVYLAAILYFVLEDLCVVCVTSYIINALLLIISVLKYRIKLSGSGKSKSEHSGNKKQKSKIEHSGNKKQKSKNEHSGNKKQKSKTEHAGNKKQK